MSKKPAQRKKPEFTGRLNLVEEPDELDRWMKCADALGVSLSAWVRMNLRAAARKTEGAA